jgi:hypothetical protein
LIKICPSGARTGGAFFWPRTGGGKGAGSKTAKAMNTQGARYHHAAARTPEGARQTPRFIETPEPAPTHDLLVMSFGPGTRPDERANHACLNSFTSNSWIMASGG